MKAIYEDHYLTDRDVANYARHSFSDLAEKYTTAQNDNLVRYLARGLRTKDWNALIDEMVAVDTFADAEKLAKYLRKIPTHWVPFGHPQITLRMSAPVPIARQAFKHKIGYVESEESRRYITVRPQLFIPDSLRAAAEDVKQGSAGAHPNSDIWLESYTKIATTCIDAYENMIKAGICPEQSRLLLPQGCEVNWVWTGSLYAFAEAYNKRSDSHAQQEIQDLFAQVDQIIEPLFPVSWAALTR